MQFHYTPYVLPLLIATGLSAAVSLYAWNLRSARVARPLALLLAAMGWWALCDALYWAGSGYYTLLLVSKLSYLGIAAVPALWLISILEYCGYDRLITRRNLGLLFVLPAVTVLLALTTDLHGLIWHNIRLDESSPIPGLSHAYGPWFWVHTAYSYVLLLISTVLIVRQTIGSSGKYHGQGFALLLTAFFPWIGNGLYLAGINLFAPLDPTPLTFIMSGAALVWAIIGFRFIDLTPLARDVVVDRMNDGLMVLDTAGQVIDLNPAFQRLLGLPASNVVGRPAVEVTNVWGGLLESDPNGPETRRETDLAGRSYELRLSPLLDGRGQIIGRTVTAHDITERKQLEQSLRVNYQQQRALEGLLRLGFEDLPLDVLLTRLLHEIIAISWLSLMSKGGIFLTAPGSDGLILKAQVNMPPAQLTTCARVGFGQCLCGRTAQTGQLIFARHVDDERHELRYEGISDHGHYVVPLKQGESLLGVLILYLPAGRPEDENEKHFLQLAANTLAEIVARKQAEDALVLARDQALEASQLKTMLLSNVNHELRTPLGTILGYAELLKVGAFDPMSENQLGALEHVLSGTHRLNEMVNELLIQAQIDSNRLKIHPAPFAVREFLAQAEARLLPLAQAKGLAFKTSIAPDLPEQLHGDVARLTMVLTDLAGNAIKFTDGGEVSVALLRLDDEHWAMRVADTGRGIPEDAFEYIFEPFRQVDGSVVRDKRGTGLGLSVAKRLAELMGGEIRLESEIGKGSTFTAVVPFAQPEEGQPG